LTVNPKNNVIVKAKWGIKFLGVNIFPNGRRLTKQNWLKINRQISLQNIASYYGLVHQYSNSKRKRYFSWRLNKAKNL
jgi:hypothetical protein